MEFKESINRTSKFNSNRTSYLSSDGKHYCYEHWDYQSECYVTEKIEIGKDISPEIACYLDKSDHDMDLNDRYQHELLGKSYETESQHSFQGDSNNLKTNTLKSLQTSNGSPEDILFAEEKPESPEIKTIRSVISKQFTEKQQNFFYEHFGMQETLEEMRKTEHELTGILPSAAAMTNRKNKIIDKAAKALGVERVKRHKYPKK